MSKINGIEITNYDQTDGEFQVAMAVKRTITELREFIETVEIEEEDMEDEKSGNGQYYHYTKAFADIRKYINEISKKSDEALNQASKITEQKYEIKLTEQSKEKR